MSASAIHLRGILADSTDRCLGQFEEDHTGDDQADAGEAQRGGGLPTAVRRPGAGVSSQPSVVRQRILMRYSAAVVQTPGILRLTT